MPIMSMMFPGHMMGSHLFGSGGLHTAISAGMVPAVPPSVPSSCQNRINVTSAPVSVPSPNSRQPEISSAPYSFWPHPLSNVFGFAPPTGLPNLANKNGLGVGPADFWLNKNAPFLRPPMPPFLAPPVQNFPPSCIPKSSTITVTPPKKRLCDNDRQAVPSPFSSVTTSAGISSSTLTSGEYCPICNQVLPMNLSAQELRRHLADDVKQTEEKFLQLKRKIALGRTATTGANSLDPATRSRLETFQRVKENRMMRMREKLANVQLSRPNTSLSNGRSVVGRDLLARQTKDDESSGRRSGHQSVTSVGSGSRSSSSTPRSMAPVHSPADVVKTPTPASSCASSPNVDASSKVYLM